MAPPATGSLATVVNYLRAVLLLTAAAAVVSLLYLFANVASLLSAYPKLDFLLLVILELGAILTLVGVHRLWHWSKAGIFLVVGAALVALLVLVHVGAPDPAKAAIPALLLLLVPGILLNHARFAGTAGGDA